MSQINTKEFKDYFEVNARKWISEGYQDNGHNYPLALHRLRIILKILSRTKRKLAIADLGCGGGQVSFALAKEGHHVWGIERSRSMYRQALRRQEMLPPSVKSRVRLFNEPLEKCSLKSNSFNVVICMGVVGYLKNDGVLLSLAKHILKRDGLLIVSCRNRLFNMVSLSDRTIREIQNGDAEELISEIDGLYSKVPSNDVEDWISRIKKSAVKLSASVYRREISSDRSTQLKMARGKGMEARQHTPKLLRRAASRFGFTHQRYFGVHPHLVLPRFNYFLPPQLYDQISRSLEAFEHLPISLVWSSCFIGVFKKVK